MLLPTIIMASFAIILFIIALQKGEDYHIVGSKNAFKMFIEVLPMLFFAFLVAGLAQSLIPTPIIAKWIGKESGFKGIMIGCIAGGITPGGPFVSLPIVATLLKTGAGIGTIVSFLTAWALWAFNRLPLEIAVLGWQLTLIRIGSTFFFPPIAGLIAHLMFASKFN